MKSPLETVYFPLGSRTPVATETLVPSPASPPAPPLGLSRVPLGPSLSISVNCRLHRGRDSRASRVLSAPGRPWPCVCQGAWRSVGQARCAPALHRDPAPTLPFFCCEVCSPIFLSEGSLSQCPRQALSAARLWALSFPLPPKGATQPPRVLGWLGKPPLPGEAPQDKRLPSPPPPLPGGSSQPLGGGGGTGDLLASQRFTAQQIQEVWGSSRSAG